MITNSHHGWRCTWHLISIFRGFHRRWGRRCSYNHRSHPGPVRDWHFIIATDVDSSSVLYAICKKSLASNNTLLSMKLFCWLWPINGDKNKETEKKRMLDTVHDLLDCHNLYPYFINSSSSRVVSTSSGMENAAWRFSGCCSIWNLPLLVCV